MNPGAKTLMRSLEASGATAQRWAEPHAPGCHLPHDPRPKARDFFFFSVKLHGV